MEMEDRLDKTGWNQGVKSTESGLLNWIICPKIGQTPGTCEQQMTQFIFSGNYPLSSTIFSSPFSSLQTAQHKQNQPTHWATCQIPPVN